MTMRAPYQDIYLITTNETSIGTSQDFDGAEIGLSTGVFNLVPTNHPNLLSGQQISDVPKATGLSQRRTGAGYEYNQTIKNPSVSGLTVEMTTKNLGLFLWLLFQQGVSQGAAAYYKKTAIPYTDSDCEVWASIARVLDASTESHQIDGAIISSMTISGSAGGVLTISADFIGATFSSAKDLDTIATAIPAEAPFLFQDGTITMATEAVKLDSFTITINNNAERRHYDSATAQKIVLGKLDVTGTIAIPWAQTNQSKNAQLANFVAGTDVLLSMTWGTASSNEVVIKSNMRYTGDPDILTDSSELMLSLPFVGAYDGTNHAIEITCEDSVNRGIDIP